MLNYTVNKPVIIAKISGGQLETLALTKANDNNSMFKDSDSLYLADSKYINLAEKTNAIESIKKIIFVIMEDNSIRPYYNPRKCLESIVEGDKTKLKLVPCINPVKPTQQFTIEDTTVPQRSKIIKNNTGKKLSGDSTHVNGQRAKPRQEETMYSYETYFANDAATNGDTNWGFIDVSSLIDEKIKEKGETDATIDLLKKMLDQEVLNIRNKTNVEVKNPNTSILGNLFGLSPEKGNILFIVLIVLCVLFLISSSVGAGLLMTKK